MVPRMKAWWERWPERLEWELDALGSAGIEFQIVEQNPKTGILRLSFRYKVSEEDIALEAVFPCFYPYTRCEIIAPNLSLRWHQNPYNRNLCLLGRGTANWDTENCLATFVATQLPKLLLAARTEDREQIRDKEELQAEPLTVFLPYPRGSVVFVLDDADPPRDTEHGHMQFRVSASLTEIRAVISAVFGKKKEAIFKAKDGPFLNSLPKYFEGYWYRSTFAPSGMGAEEFLRKLAALYPPVAMPKWAEFNGGRYELIGVRIPEESAWRKLGESWIFLLRLEQRLKAHKTAPVQKFFVRTARASRPQMQARVPELSFLASKRIAIIGLGCMGGPSSLEFARAGIGELRLMDDDSVEPGTTVRWPLGFSAVGRTKVDALQSFIENNFPYTKVKGGVCRMGAVPSIGGTSLEEYHAFFEDVDLIFDATAEEGIHYQLSDLARQMKIPYVGLSTTWGGWGGRVWAIRPGQERGCWYCLRKWINEGKIPVPPECPNGLISIPGCGDPTFTGASFDTSMIPLMAVRTTVSILSEGASGGYPGSSWDVSNLALRNEDGSLCLPHWQDFKLSVHPECPNHSQ
jgi:molybdopterin/thiamine biosynthesis adenylyltransferase